MKGTRIAGVLCVLVGGFWFLQGTGVIQSRSPMTDNPTWVLIGGAVFLAGVALLVRSWSRSNRSE